MGFVLIKYSIGIKSSNILLPLNLIYLFSVGGILLG